MKLPANVQHAEHIGKKIWAPPRLVVHGSATEITKGEIGSNLPDEFSISL